MSRVHNNSLGRLIQLDVMNARDLASLRRQFIIDLENCDLVPDFRSENFPHIAYVDLFWTYYLLHLFQSRCLSDDLRIYSRTLMSCIVEELNRRDYLDFLLFSEDLPE